MMIPRKMVSLCSAQVSDSQTTLQASLPDVKSDISDMHEWPEVLFPIIYPESPAFHVTKGNNMKSFDVLSTFDNKTSENKVEE